MLENWRCKCRVHAKTGSIGWRRKCPKVAAWNALLTHSCHTLKSYYARAAHTVAALRCAPSSGTEAGAADGPTKGLAQSLGLESAAAGSAGAGVAVDHQLDGGVLDADGAAVVVELQGRRAQGVEGGSGWAARGG